MTSEGKGEQQGQNEETVRRVAELMRTSVGSMSSAGIGGGGALGLELKLVLLTAAAYSGRHVSLVEPFPPEMVESSHSEPRRLRGGLVHSELQEGRNYSALTAALAQLPSLRSLVQWDHVCAGGWPYRCAVTQQ